MANSGGNTVSVLLGNGNGIFETSMNYTVGVFPASLIPADLNNDDKLDLAVTKLVDNTVSMLLGNGNGTFQTQSTYGTGIYPSSVISGDFNNDDKQDLIVTNRDSGDLSVFLNFCK